MSEQSCSAEQLAALKAILKDQSELLTLSLYVTTQGALMHEGEHLSCAIGAAKLRTSQHIAMCAGQSIQTILKCSEWRGIPVRDLYPIARSAVESFINAAFLLAESDHVAERASRYVSYARWKHTNRSVGSGDFSLQLSAQDSDSNTVSPEFPEFEGRGNGVWTKLDVPSRIRVVGQLAGSKAGSRLLAAYALIYSTSSEIIHGSPYGVNYFYQAYLPDEATVDDFSDATGKQLVDILCAVSHAIAGYLSAFFATQKMHKPYAVEQELFNRLLATDGVEPQSTVPIPSTSVKNGPKT